MSPEDPSFNRGIWKKLEEQVRSWTYMEDSIFEITTEILSGKKDSIGPNHVSLPDYYYYKIVYKDTTKDKMIGFFLPKAKTKVDFLEFAVTVDEIDELTGIDFFPVFPDELEEALESFSESENWDWNIKKIKKGSTETIIQQCTGFSESTGNRYKRKTKNANVRCWQHQQNLTS